MLLTTKITQTVYNDFFHGILSGNRRFCREIVARLIGDGVAIIELYERLFRDSLYDIGRLWEMNQISVATEHLATANTEMLFGTIYEKVPFPEHRDRCAVISCTPNEYHQIGGRMVADILEMNGWETCFLGANTPKSALMSMIEERKPDLVGLSLTVYFGMSDLFLLVEKIRNRFPRLPILVGGQAFLHQGCINFFDKIPDVRQISDLTQLEHFARTWNPADSK